MDSLPPIETASQVETLEEEMEISERIDSSEESDSSDQVSSEEEVSGEEESDDTEAENISAEIHYEERVAIAKELLNHISYQLLSAAAFWSPLNRVLIDYLPHMSSLQQSAVIPLLPNDMLFNTLDKNYALLGHIWLFYATTLQKIAYCQHNAPGNLQAIFKAWHDHKDKLEGFHQALSTNWEENTLAEACKAWMQHAIQSTFSFDMEAFQEIILAGEDSSDLGQEMAALKNRFDALKKEIQDFKKKWEALLATHDAKEGLFDVITCEPLTSQQAILLPGKEKLYISQSTYEELLKEAARKKELLRHPIIRNEFTPDELKELTQAYEKIKKG